MTAISSLGNEIAQSHRRAYRRWLESGDSELNIEDFYIWEMQETLADPALRREILEAMGLDVPVDRVKELEDALRGIDGDLHEALRVARNAPAAVDVFMPWVRNAQKEARKVLGHA